MGTGRLSLLVNLELLFFLGWDFYYLKGHRIFLMVPYLEGSQTILTFGGLFFYLGGMAFYYWTTSVRRGETLRMFQLVLPFLIPFFIFTVLIDLVFVVPNPLQVYLSSLQAWVVQIVLGVVSVLFLVLSMVFLPYFVQKIWRCASFENRELLHRLESLAKKAQFHHSGMKIWSVMNRSHTAAIIGIVPSFRYVMFTEKLLNYLAPEEVEAVLAHEIGHSKQKHLMYYPFLMMGMLVFAGLVSMMVSEFLGDGQKWGEMYSLVYAIPYILAAGFYFRIVFGYFSRLFEREADLYIFRLGMDPIYMIRALDHVGTATGGTHGVPCWHHYSIQNRIQFLQKAAENPAIIEKHHLWVRWSLVVFFICLAIASLTLVFLEAFPL